VIAKGMKTPYRCGSRAYLNRARELLKTESFESLFYAAFELRCGIEARMQECLEVAEDISEKKKKGWKIAHLGKNIQKAFKVGDKIVQLTFQDKTSTKRCTVYYTPVTVKLQKQGQQLGDYLHAIKKFRKADDPWWTSFKTLLEETCEGLTLATKGTLFGPLLLGPDGKTTKLYHEMEIDLLADEMILAISSDGENFYLNIQYLDSFPVNGK
jgi:hypothetical protein